MKVKKILLTTTMLAFAVSIAMADQYQATPGDGPQAPVGIDPDVRHNYRQNDNAPKIGRVATPNTIDTGVVRPFRSSEKPLSSNLQTQSIRHSRGLGYPASPTWAPNSAARYGDPERNRIRRRQGLGYGYPGYRGHGGASSYRGYRQYGNPPGYPPRQRRGR